MRVASIKSELSRFIDANTSRLKEIEATFSTPSSQTVSIISAKIQPDIANTIRLDLSSLMKNMCEEKLARARDFATQMSTQLENKQAVLLRELQERL